jgi:hypothetical protein
LVGDSGAKGEFRTIIVTYYSLPSFQESFHFVALD